MALRQHYHSKQKLKISSKASSNRTWDIWFPSIHSNGPGFRYPARTSHNEIRKSAWVKFIRKEKNLKGLNRKAKEAAKRN